MVRRQGIYNPQPRPADDRPYRLRARHPHQRHQPQGDDGQQLQDDRNPFHGHPQCRRQPDLGIPQRDLCRRAPQRSQDRQHGKVILRSLSPFLFHRSGSTHRQHLQQQCLFGTLFRQHCEEFLRFFIILPVLRQHRKKFLRIIFLPLFRQLQFLQVFLFR